MPGNPPEKIYNPDRLQPEMGFRIFFRLQRSDGNEKREKKPLVSFKAFSDGVALFAETPKGNGFELPAWLEAIEKEAQRIRNRSEEEDEMLDLSAYVKPVIQTKDKLIRTIAEMKKRVA